MGVPGGWGEAGNTLGSPSTLASRSPSPPLTWGLGDGEDALVRNLACGRHWEKGVKGVGTGWAESGGVIIIPSSESSAPLNEPTLTFPFPAPGLIISHAFHRGLATPRLFLSLRGTYTVPRSCWFGAEVRGQGVPMRVKSGFSIPMKLVSVS